MKQGLSVLPSCCVLGCFLGIGSLGFSEFRYGTRKPYQVVRVRFFGETFFATLKLGKLASNRVLNFKKNLVINFPLICPIMKMYIICCVPVQIFCLEKVLFHRYRPEHSQPFRLRNFQTPGGSQKGPMKLVLSILSSFCPSIRQSVQAFSWNSIIIFLVNFGMVPEIQMKMCVTETDVHEKFCVLF